MPGLIFRREKRALDGFPQTTVPMVSSLEASSVTFLSSELSSLLAFSAVRGLTFPPEVVAGLLDAVRGLNPEEGLRAEPGRYPVVGRREAVPGLPTASEGLSEIINLRNDIR